MKKIILVTLSLLIVLGSNVYSQNSINVILDGKLIEFDTPPIIDNGTTLVPLRAIFEALGASVEWNSATRNIVSKLNETTISLSIDSKVAYKNGAQLNLFVAPKIIDSRTMVPVRFIAESFGVEVDWDSSMKSVVLITDNAVFNGYYPYSTGSIFTLTANILKGNVVYYKGQYWATPEYAKMLGNENIVYYNDISGEESIIDRYSLINFETDWVSGYDLDKEMISEKFLTSVDVLKFEKSTIPGYYNVYAFIIKDGSTNTEYYPITDMTDEFMDSKNAIGTFSGIRMKKENGVLWIKEADLVEKKIR